MAENFLDWEAKEESGEVPEPDATEGEVIPYHVTTPVLPTGEDRPDPKWVRGKCPECGEELVSNLYYIGGKGYRIYWECWASLRQEPACKYRREL